MYLSFPQLGKIVGKYRSICNVSNQICENEKSEFKSTKSGTEKILQDFTRSLVYDNALKG